MEPSDSTRVEWLASTLACIDAELAGDGWEAECPLVACELRQFREYVKGELVEASGWDQHFPVSARHTLPAASPGYESATRL
jgi:hypothetical protein